MDQTLIVTAAIACVSLLYATAGQAGGTAFLAVMAFASFPAVEMRATALFLNILAAGYASWQIRQRIGLDRKILFQVTIPSLMAAFVGGLVVLESNVYYVLTGVLLVLAAIIVLLKRSSDGGEGRPVESLPAGLVGAGAGLMSGVTGVGGGVFLTPMLVGLGWASPRRAAALTPPFILCNSVLGFAAVFLAGQRLAPSCAPYAVGALTGAAIGMFIGHRWMSETATRYVLAFVLLGAGLRLLTR